MERGGGGLRGAVGSHGETQSWRYSTLSFLTPPRESRSVVSHSSRPHGLHSPWNSPGQNTAVGSLSLLQGIFPTQGLNLGLPHFRQILYQLSHKGSPRILKWVAYPFSRVSSQPRNQRGVLHCRGILNQLSYRGSPSL